MTAVYADMDQLKYALELTGTAHADGDMQLCLESASRAIDHVTGRYFSKSNSGVERWYTALVPRTLEIDDLVTLESLKTDNNGDGIFEMTWQVNRDFVLEPLNAQVDGVPYETVRVHEGGALGSWPCHTRAIQITGTWGWAEVPAGVVEACLIIATKAFKRKREAPFGVLQIGIDGAAIRIARSDPDVALHLSPYMPELMFA